ncbi:hypothetical protein F2P81_019790 [Scophthalmus maximus]|uniref:Uncharacterized protein n=1 Tax=Scophthalmus maximus TaxID=52904 RepID=A0A6A4S3G2_SCOMX|nr:hypothetical protein F2P81_019790 [Scophthalmus maximus]
MNRRRRRLLHLQWDDESMWSQRRPPIIRSESGRCDERLRWRASFNVHREALGCDRIGLPFRRRAKRAPASSWTGLLFSHRLVLLVTRASVNVMRTDLQLRYCDPSSLRFEVADPTE